MYDDDDDVDENFCIARILCCPGNEWKRVECWTIRQKIVIKEQSEKKEVDSSDFFFFFSMND